MKSAFTVAIMLVIAAQSFCQYTDSTQGSIRTNLLTKSKNQKSGAWVLLGGGSALIAGGLLIGNRKESSFSDAGTGAIIGALGVISILGSIPLFLGSGRNKRKAAAVGYLIFEETPLTLHPDMNPCSYPAVCVKINL